MASTLLASRRWRKAERLACSLIESGEEESGALLSRAAESLARGVAWEEGAYETLADVEPRTSEDRNIRREEEGEDCERERIWSQNVWNDFLARGKRSQMANQVGCQLLSKRVPAVAASIFDTALEVGCKDYGQESYLEECTVDSDEVNARNQSKDIESRKTQGAAMCSARAKLESKVPFVQAQDEAEQRKVSVSFGNGRVEPIGDDAPKLYYNAGLARLMAGDSLGAINAFRSTGLVFSGDPCFWVRLAESYLALSDTCAHQEPSIVHAQLQYVLGCNMDTAHSAEAASHALNCLQRAALLLQSPMSSKSFDSLLHAELDGSALHNHIFLKLAYASLLIGATRAAVGYAGRVLDTEDCPLHFKALAQLYCAESLAMEGDTGSACNLLREFLASLDADAQDGDAFIPLKQRLSILENAPLAEHSA